MIYRWKNKKVLHLIQVLGIMVLMIGVMGSARSQNLNPTLSIHQNDVKVVFHYGDAKISPKNNVMYYWTKYRKVHHTQGGYAGQLLNGKYEEYFISGQLKTNGTFKKGAKVGEWKAWFENGITEEVCFWVKGVKQGRYMVYYDSGQIKEEGSYKAGQKHGTVFTYDKEGHKNKLKFKKGKQVDHTFKKNKRKEEREKVKLEREKTKEKTTKEKAEKKLEKEKKREERESKKELESKTDEIGAFEKFKIWWKSHVNKKAE